MSRQRTINPEAALQPISAASFLTGLSQKYIRDGCKAGTIPHVKIGSDYRVHLPEFMAQLAAESKNCINDDAEKR